MTILNSPGQARQRELHPSPIGRSKAQPLGKAAWPFLQMTQQPHCRLFIPKEEKCYSHTDLYTGIYSSLMFTANVGITQTFFPWQMTSSGTLVKGTQVNSLKKETAIDTRTNLKILHYSEQKEQCANIAAPVQPQHCCSCTTPLHHTGERQSPWHGHLFARWCQALGSCRE